MERQVCFILETGNWRAGVEWVGWTPIQRLTPLPTDIQWARDFLDGGKEGVNAETAVSSDGRVECGRAVV